MILSGFVFAPRKHTLLARSHLFTTNTFTIDSTNAFISIQFEANDIFVLK